MALYRPKIAANVLDRARVQAWLTFHAQSAVRYVCAPAGSGKTTCAVLYARNRTSRVAFISLAPDTDEAALIAALLGAAGVAPRATTYADLVDAFDTLGPIEIIVDAADNATLEAGRLLARVYLDVPDHVTFMYLARSEAALPLGHARSGGLVEVCDPALFAFEAEEIAQFAISLGLSDDLQAFTKLREATYGWALAVSGVCRAAAANALRLTDALRYWRRRNAGALRDLAGDALGRVTPSIAAAFDDCLAGRSLADPQQLEAFAAAGLFVAEWNGRLQLNPLLRRDAVSAKVLPLDRPVSPAVIEMFGRFETTVDGEPVAWIRRRDRQIVQYLAMQPRGRATRGEIIAAFWPDADRQLAGQSLRSACSTIRRALAACVGRANVSRYFIGEHVLELVLDHVRITARDFSQQYELAEAAYERSDGATAFMHYRAAELAYRSPFLAGEPPTAWAAPYEARFAAMHLRIAERLDQLSVTLHSNALLSDSTARVSA